MGSHDSRWTIPVTSLLIVVSAVLVLSCGKNRHTQTDEDKRFTPVTIVSITSAAFNSAKQV